MTPTGSTPSPSRGLRRTVLAWFPWAIVVAFAGCETAGDQPREGASTNGGFSTTTGVFSVDSGFEARDAEVFFGRDADPFGDVPLWVGDAFVPVPVPEAFEFVSRSPVVGADDAAPDVQIVVTFSHPIDNPTYSRVTLTRTRDGARVSVSESTDGAELRAIPDAPLEPGEEYSVRVSAISALGLPTRRLTPSDWASSWSFRVAEPEGTIPLTGPLDALAYDSPRARLWAIERDARKLVLIDLEAGAEVARDSLTYVPSDLCLSPDGARLFIANRGTSLVSEVDTTTREVVRSLTFRSADDGDLAAELHVHCSDDRLWLVDAATAPGLWSMDLSLETPVAVDHSASVSGVGALTPSSDGNLLYLSTQQGWGPQVDLRVTTIDADTLMELDSVGIGPSSERAVALDAPVLLDATGGRVLTRNRVLQADDLSLVLFTFPDDVVLRAVDSASGRAASLTHVYSLADYRAELPVLSAGAEHVFFDAQGALIVAINAPEPKLRKQRFDVSP